MEADFLVLGRALWRSRIFVAVTALACAVLVGGASFLLTPQYTAEVTILPSSRGADVSRFAQVAMLSGIGVGGEVNPELLYGEVLHSDRVLDRIIDRTWDFDGRSGVTLGEVYDVDETDERIRRARLKRLLRSGAIGWVRDEQTGFMVLRVTVPRDAAFAAALANRCAEELDHAVGRLQAPRASETRAFVERQLATADSVLNAAENRLAEFVEVNRAYASSPILTQRFHALQRVVEAEALVWGELKRQYEIARIEEQQKALSVDILDSAVPPLEPSSPRRRLVAVLAFLAGLMAAVLVVILRQSRTGAVTPGPAC